MERHRLCARASEILDMREGHYICTECGLVLDSYFQDSDQFNIFETKCETPNKWVEQVNDILDRLNIPICYTKHILNHFETKYHRKCEKNLFDAIYTVLNNFNISITLNELANVTAYPKRKINGTNVLEITNISVDKCALVDKYCALLNLDYKTATVIKDRLHKIRKAGHSPTTIVAGVIYSVCKDLNHKITIKKISSYTSVSAISIQRFIKYEHTQR